MRGNMIDFFEVDRAIHDVKDFNSRASYAATDCLTAKHFRAYEVVPSEEATQAVVIIDGLWGTQLRRSEGELERMARLYQEKVHVYGECLHELSQVSLERAPETAYGIAKRMLATLLEPGGRKNYSFASKLFHWHAPKHLPIVDSRACKAIQKLQGEWGEERVSGVGREWARDYPRWICFYARLIGGLRQSGQEKVLLDADCRYLPPQFAIENTLLRVLDKVFWMRGKEKSDQG